MLCPTAVFTGTRQPGAVANGLEGAGAGGGRRGLWEQALGSFPSGPHFLSSFYITLLQ